MNVTLVLTIAACFIVGYGVACYLIKVFQDAKAMEAKDAEKNRPDDGPPPG